MAYSVEIAIKGIDEFTGVFRDIEKETEKVFTNIETTVESIPDIDIETNINTDQAEAELVEMEGAINSAENAIKSIPDPAIDTGQAEGEIKKIDSAVSEAESAIKSIPDPSVDGGKAENEIKGIEGAVGKAETAIKSIPDPQIDGSKAEQELAKIKDEAEETKNAIESIDFENVIGGLAASGGIAGAVEKAFDLTSMETKINIAFDVPPESVESVKKATKAVQAYGLDAEEALEGVRKQFALNSDASDEANMKIIKGAGAIASAYDEIDFNELIQEVNEIGSELNITDEEALGLANSLLQIGFPPGELDIIAEYGQQLTRAGYSAEEIQAIMAAGIETGTWNIDNLLDGLKEGRIRLAEFGQEVDDTTKDLLKGTGISAKQLQQWGQAIAGGGEKGKQAMVEVAKALNNVEDETAKNALGVKIFGTMWEDQGDNIIETLLNAEGATGDLKEGIKGVDEATEALDATPAVQWEKAMQDMNTALAPLYSNIAQVVSKVAQWISENPKLAGTIMGISVALAVIMGAFLALQPVITAVRTATQLFNMTLLTSPITWIIVGITALIAVIILLWKNWDSVSQWLSNSWDWIKEKASAIFGGLAEFFSTIWEAIKTTFSTVLETIRNWVSEKWNSIKTTTSNVWNSIKTFFSDTWQNIINKVNTAINNIKTGISNGFNKIKSIISTVWNTVKTITSNVWNGIKNVLSNTWNGLKNTVTRVFNGIKNGIVNVWDSIKSSTRRIWNSIVNIIKAPINSIIGLVNGMISRLNRVKIKIPKIPSWVPGIGGKGGGSIGFNIPKIPSLATGGVVSEPTLALVGDAGTGNPEIVAPQKMLAQIVGDELKKALGTLVTNSRTEQPQPLYITVQIGRSEFRRFVEDITKEQERNTRKEEKFR